MNLLGTGIPFDLTSLNFTLERKKPEHFRIQAFRINGGEGGI